MGNVESKFEGSSGVSDNFLSGSRVFIDSGPIVMVADAVTVSVAFSAAGSFTLRSVVIFSGYYVEKRWLVVVSVVPG